MTTCTTCAHGPDSEACGIARMCIKPDGGRALYVPPEFAPDDTEIPAVVAGCPPDESTTVAGDGRGVVPSSGGPSISAADGPSQPPPVAGSEEPTESGQAAESRPAPGAGSIPDGVHPDIPAHVYHGPEWADLVSSSTLKRWHRGPAFGLYDEDVSGSAVDIGTAFHALVEGDDDAIEVVTVASRRGKAWTEAVAELAPGRVALTRGEWETVQRTRDAVFANPHARRRIEACAHERTYAWTGDGYRGRARADMVGPGTLIDLKTTGDVRAWGDADDVGRLVADRLWHLQLAWYRAGAWACGEDVGRCEVMIATTKPPHVCEVVVLDAHALARGWELAHAALERLLYHHHTPTAWTGPSADENGQPTVRLVSLPAWA